MRHAGSKSENAVERPRRIFSWTGALCLALAASVLVFGSDVFFYLFLGTGGAWWILGFGFRLAFFSALLLGAYWLLGRGSARVQAALLAQTQHYRMQLDSASDAIYVANLEGNFLEVNARACVFLGYSRDELLRMNVREIIDPPDLERLPLQLEAMVTGRNLVFSRAFRRKNGAVVYGEVSSVRLSDTRVQAILRDITGRIKTQEQVQKQMKQAAAMNRLSRRVAESLSYEGVLNEAYEHLVSVLDLRLLALFRLMEGRLVYAAPEGLDGRGVIAADAFWGEEWRRLLEQSPENTCYIPKAQMHPEYGPLLVTHAGVEVLVILPLRAGQELLGIIVLGFGAGLHFSAERVYFEASAAQIALALRNALLHEESQAARQRLQGHVQQLLETEKAMRRSEHRFRSLVETTSDYVWEVDRNLVFTYASPRVHDMLGYDTHEVIGHPVQEFVGEENHAERMQYIERETAARRPFEHFEVHLKHKEGGEVSTETNAAPTFDSFGVFSGYRGITRNITHRKKMEAQASLDRQQLMQADKMASLGILVSGVAHEINNPNQLIMANVGLLQEAWKTVAPILEKKAAEEGVNYSLLGMPYEEALEEVPAMFGEVTDGAHRINRIVQELRDFARPALPHMDDVIDMDSVVRAATTLTGNMIKKSTSRRQLELAGNLPVFKGNFQRLEQVAINLIQNACHALAGKDGGLYIATRYDQAGKAVCLEVRDEGCGIAPEHLERLCDPFFTTKRDIGGTGLGLSISSNIIQEHGGRLVFDSKPGGPTIVRVAIPVDREENADQVAV